MTSTIHAATHVQRFAWGDRKINAFEKAQSSRIVSGPQPETTTQPNKAPYIQLHTAACGCLRPHLPLAKRGVLRGGASLLPIEIKNGVDRTLSSDAAARGEGSAV